MNFSAVKWEQEHSPGSKNCSIDKDSLSYPHKHVWCAIGAGVQLGTSLLKYLSFLTRFSTDNQGPYRRCDQEMAPFLLHIYVVIV
jgi:hypothetical protein